MISVLSRCKKKTKREISIQVGSRNFAKQLSVGLMNSMTCSVQRKPALVFQPRDKNALSLQAQTYELFTSTLLRVRSSKKKSKKNHLVVDAEMLKNPRLSHRSVIESEPSLIQAPSVCSEAGARAAPYERKTRHDRTNNRKTIEIRERENIAKAVITSFKGISSFVSRQLSKRRLLFVRFEVGLTWLKCFWATQSNISNGYNRREQREGRGEFSYSNKLTLQERDRFWRKTPKLKYANVSFDSLSIFDRAILQMELFSSGHEHADVFIE